MPGSPASAGTQNIYMVSCRSYCFAEISTLQLMQSATLISAVNFAFGTVKVVYAFSNSLSQLELFVDIVGYYIGINWDAQYQETPEDNVLSQKYGNIVAVERRIRHREVAGSSLGRTLWRKNSGQVSHTYG